MLFVLLIKIATPGILDSLDIQAGAFGCMLIDL